LDSYSLVNGSIAYKIDKYELALFATNLFDKRYFTTYNDVSVLGSALPPGLANNVGVPGDRRRIGVRTSIRF
jgi:iron complex outermembrane receptor protein